MEALTTIPSAEPPPPQQLARPLTDAEERSLVAGVEAQPFATILCVSDLHLGVGADPQTGRYAPRENFLADGPFARCLAHQQQTLPGPHLLVLNGDILDFLRVAGAPDAAQTKAWATRLHAFGDPRTAQQLHATIQGHEGEYGLQTHDFKSLWKLDVMASGHPVFFSALATWIRNGGTIAYVRGNHDAEQYWPLIRRAFRDIVRSHGADVAHVEQRIVFVEDSLAVTNVMFQHGHVHEHLTSMSDPPIRPGATELELPLGSLVNRYVVNKLELVAPYLDNMKPITDMLLATIRSHPLLILTVARRSGRLLFRALRRRRGASVLLAGSLLAVALAHLLPVLVVLLLLVYLVSPEARDWVAHSWLSSASLRTALAVGGMLVPFALPKVVNLFHGRRVYEEGEDDFAGGALATLRRRFPQPVRWQTMYAVLGHTHAEDVQELPALPGSGRTIYINTGTWIPLWPKERPDLIGRVLLTFVRFQRYDGAYSHEMLRWDDSAGAVREATIVEAL